MAGLECEDLRYGSDLPNGEIDSRETMDYRLIFEICGWATFCLATYRPGTFGDISSKDIYFPGQLLATYDNFWQFVATFDTRVATGALVAKAFNFNYGQEPDVIGEISSDLYRT